MGALVRNLDATEAAIEVMNLQSQAVVIGLGRTGLSCIRYLVRHGYRVAAVDTRPSPPLREQVLAEYPDVPVICGDLPQALLNDADMLVVSPGLPVTQPEIRRAAEAGAEIVGDVELFARHVTAPVIAITGSNGKSTVTAMTGDMCRRAGIRVCVGGNIGVPVLDLPEEACHHYVLELSSFQLETTTSLRPRAAAILNISEDHLDRYADFRSYVDAKRRIFSGAAIAVVNRDDALVCELAEDCDLIVSFGGDRPARAQDYGIDYVDGVAWLVRGDTRLLRAADMRLMGRHNCLNALAAMALAETAGVGNDAMVAAATAFVGLEHRMELVAELGSVRWINDSKATNVGAAVASLEGVGCPCVLIAGGDGKGQDFTGLREAVRRCAKAVVLMGRDAEKIRDALDPLTPVSFAEDMLDAVQRAGRLTAPGDCVLLAPACASFDMYRDFAERGEDFRDAVRSLT